jgi:hypothetical protein
VDVVLIRTEGRAGRAEIEVDGHLLTVVDGISAVGAPAAPGPVRDPAFEAVVVEPDSWERAIAANPERLKRLEPLWGWRYRGYGEIVAVDPVRADLGPLVLGLGLRADTSERLGAFVEIAIDRITLSRHTPSRGRFSRSIGS